MNVMMIEINLVCPFCTVTMNAMSGSIFTLVIGVFDFIISSQRCKSAVAVSHPLELFVVPSVFLISRWAVSPVVSATGSIVAVEVLG